MISNDSDTNTKQLPTFWVIWESVICLFDTDYNLNKSFRKQHIINILHQNGVIRCWLKERGGN